MARILILSVLLMTFICVSNAIPGQLTRDFRPEGSTLEYVPSNSEAETQRFFFNFWPFRPLPWIPLPWLNPVTTTTTTQAPTDTTTDGTTEATTTAEPGE